nr:unnamed protein product [Naegleria fowleri]
MIPCQSLKEALEDVRQFLLDSGWLNIFYERVVDIQFSITSDYEFVDDCDVILDSAKGLHYRFKFLSNQFKCLNRTRLFSEGDVSQIFFQNMTAANIDFVKYNVLLTNTVLKNCLFDHNVVSTPLKLSMPSTTSFRQVTFNNCTISLQQESIEMEDILFLGENDVNIFDSRSLLCTRCTMNSGALLFLSRNSESIIFSECYFSNFQSLKFQMLFVKIVVFDLTNVHGSNPSSDAILYVTMVSIMELKNCSFTHNVQPLLYVRGFFEVNLHNCVFEHNSIANREISYNTESLRSLVVVEGGHKFYSWNCSYFNNSGIDRAARIVDLDFVSVRGSNFDSLRNGAMSISSLVPTAQIEIIETNFSNNVASEYGGALFIEYANTVILHNLIFTNNSASLSGGGAFIATVNSHVSLFQTTFYNNSVTTLKNSNKYFDGCGGALVLLNSKQTMYENQFIENKAQLGGALCISNKGPSRIVNSLFKNNFAYRTGGAVYLTGTDHRFDKIEMSTCSFMENKASIYGDDYMTNMLTFKFQQSSYETYPGQRIFFPFSPIFNNTSIPTVVDNFLPVIDSFKMRTHSPSIVGNFLTFSVCLLENTISNVGSNVSIIDGNNQIVATNALFVTIHECPIGKRLSEIASNCYVCELDIGFVLLFTLIPAAIIFSSVGVIVGLLCLGCTLHIAKRLKRLKAKELAEKKVEQKIIDKKVIFQLGEDSPRRESISTESTFRRSLSLRKRSSIKGNEGAASLEMPLVALNFLDDKPVHSFIIPISEIEIKKKIGEGGNGVIYLARWNNLDVAMISLKTENIEDSSDEFESGVAVLASLRHPNIVSFFGIVVTDSSKYMITEYLENGSLDRLIYKCKTGKITISFAKKLEILIDIASGMNYLHSLNPAIVHRDLKPANVLLTTDLRCKTIADEGEYPSNHHNIDISSASSKAIRAPKIDIYSFGIIMWELFFEVTPYSVNKKLGNATSSISPLNVLTHVVKGTRPSIPFQNEETLLQWLKDYPIQHDTMSPQTFTTTILDYFKLMKHCWDGDPLRRPSFSSIMNKLKTIHQTILGQ